METKHIVTIILVIGLVLVIFGIYHSFNKTTTSVQGSAEINANPEFLTIYFNAEHEANTASEASSEVAEIIEELKINLYRIGISPDDIQTENYNIREKYHEDEFIATETIRVKTKKFYNAGGIVDAGVEAGALINYINFEISLETQNELKAQALEAAAEDARNKAESLARGSGKKLGKLVSIGNSHSNYGHYRLYEAATASADENAKQAVTDITPKELTIYANINAVYEIY